LFFLKQKAQAKARPLALTLFVARIRAANHAHNAFALDDLAITANALNRCHHFHDITLFFKSLRPEHDPRTRQIVRRQFNRHLVARQDTDVMHAHLARDVSQHDMAIFQLYPESRVGEVLNDLTLHLDHILFVFGSHKSF
jgi:hypothetical protein